jgi:RNA polymerase sigma-70 factor (ECF subfamily)
MGRDPALFDGFYQAYLDTVLRYVTRRTIEPHTAADLTADVFVAAIETAHTYQPERGAPVAWLYGIAANVVAAHRRRSLREGQVARRIAGRRLLDDADIAALEARIDAERAAREVLARMVSLPDSLRTVLELVTVDGLTIDAAAAALGIRPATARVRLHRARRRIHENPTLALALELKS